MAPTKPKRSTMAFAAGPRLSKRIPRITPIPTNPTPTIRALRTAKPGLGPESRRQDENHNGQKDARAQVQKERDEILY